MWLTNGLSPKWLNQKLKFDSSPPRISISSLSESNPHSSVFLLSNAAARSWEIHFSDNLTSHQAIVSAASGSRRTCARAVCGTGDPQLPKWKTMPRYHIPSHSDMVLDLIPQHSLLLHQLLHVIPALLQVHAVYLV